MSSVTNPNNTPHSIMNFKNFIPFAAVLVCSLGNPAQVEARTPQPVTGDCILSTKEISVYRCTVTPDGGMGYIIDMHGAAEHNFYANPVARELYYGPNNCAEPVFNEYAGNVSALCTNNGVWTVVFPTR